LYWQFNDAWPAISWAAIDYYGRWKPLQFMAKRTFPNIAIFTKKNGSVIAINDNLYAADVVIKLALVQFDG
jgi:beta-mannosidase